MTDEAGFLRGILENPEGSTRLVYADWLEEHGNPRAAEFLRMDPALERIRSYAEGRERRAAQHLRQERRALSSTLDANWVAFINTLACPFRPFSFLCREDELPFAERIGTRGLVITLEPDFRHGASWDEGLMGDLRFLSELELGRCWYGAANMAVYPFLCELKGERRPLTGSDVLAALRPRAFRSAYIRTLDATYIPYPGYNPSGGQGPNNDEIHNDFWEQNIFSHETGSAEEGSDDEFTGTHGVLKRFVADGQLWYVLLHTTPQQFEEVWISEYVVLFAVGLSPNGDRLVGVVTHQVCHNLCD
jgi:uncharacterized protein (TIGR02996 family)